MREQASGKQQSASGPDSGHDDGTDAAAHAIDPVLKEVYHELRALAGHLMRSERDDHTLQPTALVHEAVLRILDQRNVDVGNRPQVIALAASAMRRILVDHARRRHASKRDAGIRVAMPENVPDGSARDMDLLAVDEALVRLSALDPRQGRIVELRYFAGLSIEETAATLGVSPATVKRDWVLARAWLQQEIEQ